MCFAIFWEKAVDEFFFIQDLHLNFHSFLGFQHGSGSSVMAIMRLSATLPSDWFEMFLVSMSITVIPKINHSTWIIWRYCTFVYPPPFCYWWLIMKKRGWKLYRSLNPNPSGERKCNSADYLSSILDIFVHQTSFQKDLDESVLSVHT